MKTKEIPVNPVLGKDSNGTVSVTVYDPSYLPSARSVRMRIYTPPSGGMSVDAYAYLGEAQARELADELIAAADALRANAAAA